MDVDRIFFKISNLDSLELDSPITQTLLAYTIHADSPVLAGYKNENVFFTGGNMEQIEIA